MKYPRLVRRYKDPITWSAILVALLLGIYGASRPSEVVVNHTVEIQKITPASVAKPTVPTEIYQVVKISLGLALVVAGITALLWKLGAFKDKKWEDVRIPIAVVAGTLITLGVLNHLLPPQVLPWEVQLVIVLGIAVIVMLLDTEGKTGRTLLAVMVGLSISLLLVTHLLKVTGSLKGLEIENLTYSRLWGIHPLLLISLAVGLILSLAGLKGTGGTITAISLIAILISSIFFPAVGMRSNVQAAEAAPELRRATGSPAKVQEAKTYEVPARDWSAWHPRVIDPHSSFSFCSRDLIEIESHERITAEDESGRRFLMPKVFEEGPEITQPKFIIDTEGKAMWRWRSKKPHSTYIDFQVTEK